MIIILQAFFAIQAVLNIREYHSDIFPKHNAPMLQKFSPRADNLRERSQLES